MILWNPSTYYALSLLIVLLFIVLNAQREHKVWLNAWNKLARCAKVVDTQGKFVSAENFYGDYRGLTVELRIITKHIDTFGASNIFTRMSVHTKQNREGDVFVVDKNLGKDQIRTLTGRVINQEGSIKCYPRSISTIILSNPLLTRWLRSSNFSQLEFCENRIDLYFQGIVTDVARLHAGLRLLHKLAKQINELDTTQGVFAGTKFLEA